MYINKKSEEAAVSAHMNALPGQKRPHTMRISYGDGQKPVDLNLARTYIPGIVCILKSMMLVLVLHAATKECTAPALLLMIVPLWIDRITALESIFDANAVLCTLHASFVINSMRIEFADHLYLNAPVWRIKNSVVVASVLDFVLNAGCTAAGVLLVLDVVHALRVERRSLYIMACLLACLLQVPHQRSGESLKSILLRSASFVCLSVTWIYSVGIYQMIDLLSRTTRLPPVSIVGQKSSARRRTNNTIVQSFNPCILRFAPMLCMSGWWQVANITALAASLVLKIVVQNREDPPGIHPDYCMHALSLVLHQEHEEEDVNGMSFKRIPLHAVDRHEGSTARAECRAQCRPPGTRDTPPSHATEASSPVPKKEPAPPGKGMDDEQDVYDLFQKARQAAMEPARLPV